MPTAPLTNETPATVTIRPATEQDFTAATDLFRSTMGAQFVLGQDLWTAVCTAPSHRALVATNASDTVVGMAIVVVSDRIRLAAGTRRRRYHLDELIVSPANWRQGIGRTLLEHVEEMARQDTPSYIIVNCDFMNVAARKTYESAGLHLVRQSADRFEVAFS